MKWFRALFDNKPHPNFERFTGIGTVLFSDVFGFADLAEGSDPLTIVSAMTRLKNIQVEAVRAHEGIFSSQSDIMLAHWPPSQANPSHAEMAFKCGRQMLKGIARLQTEEIISPGVRIALGTGDMTGDLIGGRYQIVGRACVTAKRLMDLKVSKTTSMLCAPETLALIPKSVAPRQALTKIQGSNGEEIDVYEFRAKDFL